MTITRLTHPLSAVLGAATIALLTSASFAQTVEITANMPATPDMVEHLPAAVKERGSLNVATTDGNAPGVFVDAASGEVKGVDADLVNEAAKRLGLTVNWNHPVHRRHSGRRGGRYDFYLSAMADTKREEVVNFIAYSQRLGRHRAQGQSAQHPDHGRPVRQARRHRHRLAVPAIIDELNKSCASPVQMSRPPTRPARISPSPAGRPMRP